MTTRIKEIKGFIEGELYNPYKGMEFKYKEYGSDGFMITNDCWKLKVDLTWGDIEVTTHKGFSIGKCDCEWIMSIVDSLPKIQQIWDEYEDL